MAKPVRLRPLAAVVCGTLVAMLFLVGPARATVASATDVWTVRGPAPFSGPSAELRRDPSSGALTLAVVRDGQTVVEPSPVGITTTTEDLTGDLRFLGRSDRPVVEHYRTAAGKRRERFAVMDEARFRFAGDGGARLEVVVRVSHDGVAYRYDLPANSGDVLGESSAFTFPADTTAWLGVWRVDNENNFVRYQAAGAPAGEYMMQGLFETGGTYALVAESNVTGSYSGAHLVHAAGSPTYGVKLADPQVETDGKALRTPWRAIVVGDLATVTESTFTDDIAPASKVTDTSWIKPGDSLWTWLAGGRAADQSLTAQEGFVDYAAKRGWPYVTVDAGWYFDPNQWDVTDPDWQTDSWMPDLVKYAAAEHVGIQVWMHYRDLDTPEERAQWLPTLEKWGVKGVKIDFMNSESQQMMRWYDTILPETAEHHLMVDFHGATLPKGIQRTWPQVMTMEGVNGEEKKTNTAAHLTTLPYTRNVIGSMDFTPGAFQKAERPDANSDAGELGLTVVYESGVQNLAGTIASYDARPVARDFLEQVPAAWDATHLLAGQPGQSAVIARKNGGRWFLGGIFNGPAQTVDVPLRLDPGTWLVEIVRDGGNGLVREPHVVHDGDTLSVPVTANGGFAGIACRWHAGLTGCDR
jgi:alpha-glucosidase